MKQIFSMIISFLFFVPIALQAADTLRNESPNILFILSDDQGWSQVSKPMHPEISESHSNYLSTPNIDRLGDSGIRFTNGYAPAPICTPTRRSILCGVSTARGGTEFKSSFIPADHMTIPQAMAQANPAYMCAHFGKWGGETMISSPGESGYIESDGITGNPTGGMPATFGYKNHREAPPYFIDNRDPKRTSSVTDSAIEFMRRAVDENRPFYVQASYYAPHLSIVCGQEMLNRYLGKGEPDRGYPPAWAAMLDEMDQGVGRLLDFLDDLHIDENTYVFFSSDNGGSGSVPGKNDDRKPLNHPLSGSKSTLMEGGIRVPFIVRGPGIKPGSHSNVPVVGYDLLPTFYDIAGGVQELPDEIDGGSIRHLFHDPVNGVVKRPLDAIVFHHPGKLSSAIRQGSYKLYVTWDQNGNVGSRYLFNFDDNVVENENTDIAELNIRIADQMQQILIDYLKSVDAKDPITILDYLPGNQTKVSTPPGFDE